MDKNLTYQNNNLDMKKILILIICIILAFAAFSQKVTYTDNIRARVDTVHVDSVLNAVSGFSINGLLSFPTSDGTNGQVLTTDGSGTLTFEDSGGGVDSVADFSGGTFGSGNYTFQNGSVRINASAPQINLRDTDDSGNNINAGIYMRNSSNLIKHRIYASTNAIRHGMEFDGRYEFWVNTNDKIFEFSNSGFKSYADWDFIGHDLDSVKVIEPDTIFSSENLQITADTVNINTDIVDISGDVDITGSLSKGSGTFKITHPLDTSKWLYHSFVEAPRADNIYRGKVQLENGIAHVNIDSASNMTVGTFAHLNQNVQVFVTNNDTWDNVKASYFNGVVTIECENTSSTATIDWLVIGERKDQTVIDWDLTDENGHLIPEWDKNE